MLAPFLWSVWWLSGFVVGLQAVITWVRERRGWWPPLHWPVVRDDVFLVVDVLFLCGLLVLVLVTRELRSRASTYRLSEVAHAAIREEANVLGWWPSRVLERCVRRALSHRLGDAKHWPTEKNAPRDDLQLLLEGLHDDDEFAWDNLDLLSPGPDMTPMWWPLTRDPPWTPTERREILMKRIRGELLPEVPIPPVTREDRELVAVAFRLVREGIDNEGDDFFLSDW
jgi:hypothetical protein